jgi:hypothetical protein
MQGGHACPDIYLTSGDQADFLEGNVPSVLVKVPPGSGTLCWSSCSCLCCTCSQPKGEASVLSTGCWCVVAGRLPRRRLQGSSRQESEGVLKYVLRHLLSPLPGVG